MDDLKRKIYMRALELIHYNKKPYICAALDLAYAEIAGEWLDDYGELEEFFPEFFNLADYRTWIISSSPDRIFAEPWKCKDEGKIWWSSWWQEPRIRILNCILNTY